MNAEIWGLILGSIGATVSVITLVTLFARGILGVESRLTRLETKVDLFWDFARKVVVETLAGKAPNNPISEERWSYLLSKFDSDTLTSSEAIELRQAFIEREQKAKEERDFATLLAIGLGLALLAVILEKKT